MRTPTGLYLPFTDEHQNLQINWQQQREKVRERVILIGKSCQVAFQSGDSGSDIWSAQTHMAMSQSFHSWHMGLLPEMAVDRSDLRQLDGQIHREQESNQGRQREE